VVYVETRHIIPSWKWGNLNYLESDFKSDFKSGLEGMEHKESLREHHVAGYTLPNKATSIFNFIILFFEGPPFYIGRN